jgi:hypothetical protein
MIHFFHRAGDMLSCETRLEADGPGYELVVTEGRTCHVEHFDDVRRLENRQSELRYSLLSHGWRTTDPSDDVGEQ